MLCAAGAGACIGFLWWNAAPAKIFMGDTGSLALGGMLAGLSITTSTELLMVVIGALFVAEAASVVIQVAVFRSSRRRVFRMAPFHHHFELAGWAETTVIIRFWLLAAIASAIGLALFYSEYSQRSEAENHDQLSGFRERPVLAPRYASAGRRWAGVRSSDHRTSRRLGAVVTVADSTLDFAERCAELGAGMVTTTSIEDAPDSITEYGLVVTSPGFRPDAPILAAAAGHGIPIWGETSSSPGASTTAGTSAHPRKWLVVTGGTNGKTTTTSMLASILDAAGVVGRACGNIGLPILDALAETSPRVEYLAVELSSFQLHWRLRCVRMPAWSSTSPRITSTGTAE